MWSVRDTLMPLALIAMCLVLAGFAIQVWPEEWGGGSSDDPSSEMFQLYDCVPSSRFGVGVDGVTGSAELVTIDGTDYVRMNDLGEFQVYVDGVPATYEIGKAQMDLVIFAGQSNSVRFTNPSYYSGATTVLPGQGFYLGTVEPSSDEHSGIMRESHSSTADICDIVADDGSMRVAQMYPSFYGDYIAETGHRLITASTGISGRPIEDWDDGGRCDKFVTKVMGMLKAACEGKVDLTPVAVLWVQGESSTQTEEYYLEHFLPLLEKLETGYYAGYSFPHITSSLPRVLMRPIDNMIDTAIAQISAESLDPHFTVATQMAYRATEDQYRDGVHFTQEYYGWVGEAFARQAAMLTGSSPVPETIVLSKDAGAVSELPSTVECYGTSGDAFQLSAAWTETETAGTYAATLSGNPEGTELASGLTATATLQPSEELQESE